MGGATQVQYCSSVQQLHPAEAAKPSWWSSRSLASRVVALTISLAVIGFSLDFLQRQTDVHELRHYSVAIDSVSGLDPVTDLLRRRPVVALDPEFNLTVRVASSGIWATECAEPGMYVEVSYRDVALASSVAMTAERICAGPKKMAEKAVVARGAGVVVPGSVLGSLAMQMRSEGRCSMWCSVVGGSIRHAGLYGSAMPDPYEGCANYNTLLY